jgi:hypothetical protein
MSMFTDRLRTDRNPFDNWDLREQAADLIEKQAARIEALEAALRMLIDNVETGSYESTGQATDSARAALAPEQDK